MQILYDYLTKNPVEALGAVLTILCIWLNTKANIWGWIVGSISTICYMYVAYELRLWGFCLLNLFFLVIGIYGLWNWKYGSKTTKELPITSAPPKLMVSLVCIGGVLSILFTYFLRYMGSASPEFDALIFAFSLVAQWQLAAKQLQNWLLWIPINALTIVLFFDMKAWVSMGLYIILFLLALHGYWTWKKIITEQKTVCNDVS